MKRLIFHICYLNLLCFFSGGFWITETAAQSFQIDTAQSEVRILLYPDGILSGLSHNHVLVGQQIKGTIALNLENLNQSNFQMKIPVSTLSVDQPEHRKQEGFDSSLSQKETIEIRETMLSHEVLDGSKYPHVIIHSTAVSGNLPNLQVTAELTIHGVSQQVNIPVKVKYSEKSMIVTGEFSLKQTDFDIQPIQLFLGSIQVKDTFFTKFHIIAIPVTKTN